MQGAYNSAPVLDEDSLSIVAKEYIAATFGPTFGLDSLYLSNTTWWARICYYPESDEPVTVGRIQIDSQSGQVVPLTLTEIQELRERGVILVAHRHSELGRDSRGYILPLQAKNKVNGYISSHVVFFGSSEGQPEWIDGSPPLWRVTTVLRLREYGKVCELGYVDVNALTG